MSREGAKIHAVTDAKGLPIALKRTAGQVHDRRMVDAMLGTVRPGRTPLADAAHDSDWLRDHPAHIAAAAAIRQIPRRPDPPPPDRETH